MSSSECYSIWINVHTVTAQKKKLPTLDNEDEKMKLLHNVRRVTKVCEAF